MACPLLIIISGPPCTGKTTLGRKLAEELRLCFLSRDDIKESLFDSLGWEDREWSKKLGGASYDLLYQFAESLLVAGSSFIIESNFDPARSTPEFLALKRKYGFRPFQIVCRTDGQVLVERFRARSESGERHPGHVDHLNFGEFEDRLTAGAVPALGLEGPVFEIDTTDFERIPVGDLLTAIRGELSGTG